MKLSFKQVVAGILTFSMVLPLANSPFTNKSFAAATPGVTLTVTDATGIKGTKSNNTTFKTDVNPINNALIKGQARAELSYFGSAASKLWYQFVKVPVSSQTKMPATGWIEIPLNGTTNNPDVLTDQPGNLNRRSYDVTMLPNISSESKWNDRTKVYEHPFDATEIVPAATATTLAQYGQYINYLNYENANRRRYYANTVFGALNGTGDMRPADDTVNISGVTRAKYQESSKFWGYFKAPSTGTFYMGLVSDDGSTGTLTVDGKSVKFSDQFKVQGSTWNSTTTNSVNLIKDKYYPIHMEYFNWGGDSRFQFYYSNVNFNSINSSTKVPNNATRVPQNWLYPSKTNAPGEFAETTFAGSSGVDFPTAVGDYYVLYKATNPNGVSVISGSYGPFTVPSSAEVSLSKRAVYSNGVAVTNIQSKTPFNIEYSIIPHDIVPNAILTDLAGTSKSFVISDFRIQDSLTDGFKVVSKPDKFIFSDPTTTTKYTGILDPIKYTLITLPNGSQVYRANSTVYTVGVELNMIGTSVQISKDKLSLITYTDPSNGAKVSREFNNGTIALLAPTTVEVTGQSSLESKVLTSITSPYEGKYKDQDGNDITGNKFEYSLHTPVTGVSIDKITGLVTITPEAVAGGFTVVATGNGLTGTKLVTLTKEAFKPTILTVSGASTLESKVIGNTTSTYTGTYKDQKGNDIVGNKFEFSLQTPVIGVTINNVTGLVTITPEAVAGSFTVVATGDGLTGTKLVTLTKEAFKPTILTVSGASTLESKVIGNTTSTYTGTYKDQKGNDIVGNKFEFSLQTPVIGVTINNVTGLVTITPEAVAGGFTVIATGNGLTGTKLVTLTKEALKPTTLTVNGESTLESKVIGDITSTYLGTYKDQKGNDISGKLIDYTLQAPVTGVIIDKVTGLVTITPEAVAGSFTVVATGDGLTGTKLVTLTKEALKPTTLTVSGASTLESKVIGDITSTYLGTYKDQKGNDISGKLIDYTLQAPVTGVIIDKVTGLVTITPEAVAGSFTVVATGDGLTGTKLVTLTKEALKPTTLTVSGASTLESKVIGDITSTYLGTYKDQKGNDISGKLIDYTLQAPVTGVIIDKVTGLVTITPEAVAGSFTVIATGDGLTGTKLVTLTKEALKPTTLIVNGESSLESKVIGDTTSTYIGTYKDQKGNDISGKLIDYTLQAPVTGVIIDKVTGLVTITPEAVAGGFTVVATGNGLTGTKLVTLTKEALKPTTLTVSGASSLESKVIGNTTSTYIGTYKDQKGNDIVGKLIAYSLQTPVIGVSIDKETGLVTITPDAVGGSFTVVAKGDELTGTKTVTITAPTSITITGPKSLISKQVGTVTTKYTAKLYDQNDDEIKTTITYSLKDNPIGSGISINSSTGDVTLNSKVSEKSFMVVATAGKITNEMKVDVTLYGVFSFGISGTKAESITYGVQSGKIKTKVTLNIPGSTKTLSFKLTNGDFANLAANKSAILEVKKDTTKENSASKSFELVGNTVSTTKTLSKGTYEIVFSTEVKKDAVLKNYTQSISDFNVTGEWTEKGDSIPVAFTSVISTTNIKIIASPKIK